MPSTAVVAGIDKIGTVLAIFKRAPSYENPLQHFISDEAFDAYHCAYEQVREADRLHRRARNELKQIPHTAGTTIGGASPVPRCFRRALRTRSAGR